VFANAGAGAVVPLEKITVRDYEESFALNVRGVLFTVQKALPLLRDGSSIIITGSIAGSKGIPAMSIYGAAKAAVRSFARTWTQELKGRRIRTNVLSPGPVRTAATNGAPPEFLARIVAGVPMGRISEAAEIAAAALFLASDDASFVTGIELFADGGAAQV
jgi:NAD(P)-dependent dehydrogenase (short-subunit alcohol dehydrogenase family)